MKLNIGENIRTYRRAMDMTQEELAEQLGVSYQSVSRWENGACYPDMELLPALARIFSVTMDELLGYPDDREKRKRFSELAEKFHAVVIGTPEKNADTIVSIIREVRRNFPEHINGDPAYIFRNFFTMAEYAKLYDNPDIKEELYASMDLILKRSNDNILKSQVIKSMATIIPDDELDAFLSENTTENDLSKNSLLRERYQRRMEWEKLAESRQEDLYWAIKKMCTNEELWLDRSKSLDAEYCLWQNKSRVQILNAVRNVTSDPRHPVSGNGEVDLWVADVIMLGMHQAGYRASTGDKEGAFLVLEDVISLMEKVYALPDGTVLRAGSPALDKIEDNMRHEWADCRNRDYDELCVIISVKYSQFLAPFITSSMYNGFAYKDPIGDWFNPICDDPRYKECVRSVKALVQKREKQQN